MAQQRKGDGEHPPSLLLRAGSGPAEIHRLVPPGVAGGARSRYS